MWVLSYIDSIRLRTVRSQVKMTDLASLDRVAQALAAYRILHQGSISGAEPQIGAW
jgi:hypothetical protein